MSELLPPGCDSLRDAPYTLHDAIKMALTFLSFEELLAEDQPPRHIWLDSKKLAEHFENVKRRQREKSGGREIEDEVRNSAIDLLVN